MYSKFIFKCAGMQVWIDKVDEYIANVNERIAI